MDILPFNQILNKVFSIKLYVLTISISILAMIDVFGQINIADSSAQIIGYWSIGDKQSYDMSLEKYKTHGGDTSSRILIRYEVDITIKDSTADSYTIEWFYKNYEVETDIPFVGEFMKAAEDVSVLIKTDEYGAVKEVLNWEEVRDYMGNSMKILMKEFADVPELNQMIEQTMAAFNSKESVEANAIQDAIQFYTFHGGRYVLNEEVNGQMQFANNFGGPPFDVDVNLWMDELNEENDNSVIRMYQEVNPEQLKKATFEYLFKSGFFGEEMPNIEDLPGVTNEVWTASRIHGSTGWTTYSISTKEVTSEGNVNFEERIIEIK